MKKTELLQLAEQESERLIALRREIHAHPELSEQEYRTRALVCRELERLGVPYEIREDDTGVVGLIRGQKDGPVIALRADMDALPITEQHTELPFCSETPGVMHACGHDMHTAIQLGAAALLKKLAPRLCGSVKLIFQPAEEAGTHGADFMVKHGCMENPKVDKIFAIHVDAGRECGTLGTKPGVLNSASDSFQVKVCGKAAHGTKPQCGIDAVFAAVQMINALYGMSTRRLSALERVSLNVGTISGGTANNIIADEAHFGISLRTVDKDIRAYMHREIRELLEGIASAHKAQVEITETYGSASQINDEDCVDLIRSTSDLLWGKQAYIPNEDPSMGSEDFSAYCEDGTPGAMWELGVRNTELGMTAPLHSGLFCPDERAILVGTAMQTAIVYRLIGEDGMEEN